MRLLPALLATTVGLAASGVGAAPLLIAAPKIEVRVDRGDEPIVLFPSFDRLSGVIEGSFVLCDGSVLIACDGSVTPSLSISVQGSVFPFLSMLLTFADNGDATTLDVNVSSGIPVIPGLATTEIGGSLTVSPGRGTSVSSPLPSGTFIEGYVAGPSELRQVADVGDGSIGQNDSTPTTETWGPFAGSFDCAEIGGCSAILMRFGLIGNGNGEVYTMEGRFDVDAAPVTPVPLPAPAALLAAGLALLGLRARRRR